MLDRLSSFVIAATLIIMTVIVAIISGAEWAPVCLIALAGIAGAAIVYTAAPAPVRELVSGYPTPASKDSSGSLLLHPDFARWSDQKDEPIIGVSDHIVTLANEAAVNLLGRHIVGEDVRTALRHPEAAELFDLYEAGEATKVVVSLTDYPRAGHRWFMRIAQLSGRDAIILLEDRSEIDAADRMRSDFVANASHELRTPLAAILGYVETLQDMADGASPMQTRFLSIIDREAKRMQRLILDLLSVSRVEAERFRRPTDIIDLSKIIRSTISQIRDSSEARPDDIVDNVSASSTLIIGDSVQISQLVHNVITNAMKYGAVGTPVTVSLRTEQTRAIFSVQDEGDGISADHIPRLTERFYRVDDARSKAVGGTGLGLAIVKHISERHRGQLTIDSQVGVGTTFSVSLPLVDPAQ